MALYKSRSEDDLTPITVTDLVQLNCDMTKVWLLGLGALLVQGSPVPQDQSQACSDYEWFNPRVNACQSYASTSSCELLGKQAQSC